MARPVPDPLHPLWPEMPRLCPAWALPAYRYVPGLNPHPVRSPAGHSYSRGDEPVTPLSPDHWRENEAYLYGIDLYHQGFLWESHEAWEGLWRQIPRESPQARLLQGLIQNSAAQLKVHVRAWAGAASLSRRACGHFEAVVRRGGCDAQGRFVGLDVRKLIEQMQEHYASLWTAGLGDAPHTSGSPPCLSVIPSPPEEERGEAVDCRP